MTMVCLKLMSMALPLMSHTFTAHLSQFWGSSWASESKNFQLDTVSYDYGKLFVNTSLGTWEHSNGDFRYGEEELVYFDDEGNSYPYKVCTFQFDQLNLTAVLKSS